MLGGLLMSYFLYQGHQIYYEDIGKGKPVVFLHGNTASSKMFQFLLPFYSQYRVILIDFLGNGRSERLTSFPENIWIEWGKQTIALVEHIRTTEPHFRPSLIGTSGGAWAAINAALEASEKIDINVDTTFATMKTYYDNSKMTYNGNVYALGFSVGGRFYCNSKDKASGFFLMPKIGTTIFMTENREYIKESSTYTNRMSYMYDFYISGELGFRIDMSRGLGVNSGVRPFLDISIIDIGLSYNNLIRLVPLPRFAIGILF